jgi:phosphoglycolate phosphatase-like HAD superfamily hydrolase
LSHSRELLEFLSRNQIPAGVISNKQHVILGKEITHMGWMPLLSFYIGAGITERDKPAPDQLLRAAAETGFSGRENELWYVGDTETDMEAAHAAGFIPVFIKHGLGKNEEEYPYPPVCATNDCKGVISCIQELL